MVQEWISREELTLVDLADDQTFVLTSIVLVVHIAAIVPP